MTRCICSQINGDRIFFFGRVVSRMTRRPPFFNTRYCSCSACGRSTTLRIRKPETSASKVWGGTFHAVGWSLVRVHAAALGLPPSPTVLDAGDAADLIDLVRDEEGLAASGRRAPRKRTLLDIYSRTVNAQRPLSDGRERHRARPLLARRPAKSEEALEQRGAERAREMRPPDAPVEAGETERPAPALHGCEIDPEHLSEMLAVIGERELPPVAPHAALLAQAVVHEHPELAGEVVVAHARLAHRRVRGP